MKANRTNRSFTSMENRNARLSEQSVHERRQGNLYDNFSKTSLPVLPTVQQHNYNQDSYLNNCSNYSQFDRMSQPSQCFVPTQFNPPFNPQPFFSGYGYPQFGNQGSYGFQNSNSFQTNPQFCNNSRDQYSFEPKQGVAAF